MSKCFLTLALTLAADTQYCRLLVLADRASISVLTRKRVQQCKERIQIDKKKGQQRVTKVKGMMGEI